jgi:hypothetical protein
MDSCLKPCTNGWSPLKATTLLHQSNADFVNGNQFMIGEFHEEAYGMATDSTTKGKMSISKAIA